MIAAIEAQAGTASYYGMGQQDGAVAGVSGTVRATLYQGDSSAVGHAVVSGHWLTGAGQVVVPGQFLESTGTEIGDTVRVTVGKETAMLRIVGEAFGSSDDEMEIQANTADFPATKPRVFLIDVKPGVSAVTYAEKLGASIKSLGADVRANPLPRRTTSS